MIIGSREKWLDLSKPRIMGILNVTPDSFHDGGKYTDIDRIVSRVSEMVAEGADIIDVGGMSSRPGAEIISIKDEMARIVPALEAIKKAFPDTVLSIDTLRSEVANVACDIGASIVNDISGGQFDENMLDVVADKEVTYISMHMQGVPHSMQKNPSYDNVVKEILDAFSVRLRTLKNKGITRVIIDPGFGFGKSVEDNYKLLSHLHIFKILEVPLMVGLSRKSMLYKPLEITADTALNATTAAHVLTLVEGVDILRVHDVAEAQQAIEIYTLYRDNG